MSNSSSSRPPPTPPSQTPSEAEDVTWLDFLRTAGHTVPVERTSSSSSTDRKRRHAGSSPDRRGYPFTPYDPSTTLTGRRPSELNMANVPGSSIGNAIDLSTPPRQQRPQIQMPVRNYGVDDLTPNMGWLGGLDPNVAARSGDPTDWRNADLVIARSNVRHVSSRSIVQPGPMAPRRESERRESDIVLPQWQPDSDVSKCPVCQTDFHFFYRKHHCRKCGRVVCAACSPHRITIPRQYIVQPPASSDGEQIPASPVTAASSGRNLGGGEIVRVCNPCVPDPWTPETAADEASRQQQQTSGQRQEGCGQSIVSDRYRHPAEAPGRTRAYSHQPTHLHHGHGHPNVNTSGIVYGGPYTRPPPEPPRASRPIPHRHTQSSNRGPFPHFAQLPPGQMPQPVPPPPAQQARPRREVREEDECPVCGIEMPAGQNVREAHIQECITLRFSSTPSSSSLPTHTPSAPPPRTSSMPGMPAPVPSTAASIPPSGAATPPNSRPRATSFAPRGMVRYRATEKDCLTEDGEPQECVICFEEFQPGDEMGRMECLCKFHRLCVRRWWDTKGNGSCPTHQLHD